MSNTNANILDEYLTLVHAIKTSCDVIINQYDKLADMILSSTKANEIPDDFIIEEYARLGYIVSHAHDLRNQVSNPMSALEMRDWMKDNSEILLLAFAEYDRSVSQALGL